MSAYIDFVLWHLLGKSKSKCQGLGERKERIDRVQNVFKRETCLYNITEVDTHNQRFIETLTNGYDTKDKTNVYSMPKVCGLFGKHRAMNSNICVTLVQKCCHLQRHGDIELCDTCSALLQTWNCKKTAETWRGEREGRREGEKEGWRNKGRERGIKERRESQGENSLSQLSSDKVLTIECDHPLSPLPSPKRSSLFTIFFEKRWMSGRNGKRKEGERKGGAIEGGNEMK